MANSVDCDRFYARDDRVVAAVDRDDGCRLGMDYCCSTRAIIAAKRGFDRM